MHSLVFSSEKRRKRVHAALHGISLRLGTERACQSPVASCLEHAHLAPNCPAIQPACRPPAPPAAALGSKTPDAVAYGGYRRASRCQREGPARRAGGYLPSRLRATRTTP